MPALTFEEHLHALRDEIEQARNELLRAIEGVPPHLLDIAPRGEWSIAAVLRHLVASEHLYASGIDVLRGQHTSPLPEAQPIAGAPEALQALTASRQRFLDALDGVTEDEFYQMRQLGLNEESIKSILENLAMHDHEHAQQIAKTVAEVADA